MTGPQSDATRVAKSRGRRAQQERSRLASRRGRDIDIDLRDGAERVGISPSDRAHSRGRTRSTATKPRPGADPGGSPLSGLRALLPKLGTGLKARILAGALVALAAVLVMLGLRDRPEPTRFDVTVTESELEQGLASLRGAVVVREWEPSPPYRRADYMPRGWADLDGDCRDTRTEVLAGQSISEAKMSANGCEVVSGEWIDPYTGLRFSDPNVADIDHVVALAEAHRAGAWRLSAEERIELANDRWARSVGLAVVERRINQSKADRPPQEWLPPVAERQCSFALRWIAVKDRWSLAFQATEVEALTAVLDRCQPLQPLD